MSICCSDVLMSWCRYCGSTWSRGQSRPSAAAPGGRLDCCCKPNCQFDNSAGIFCYLFPSSIPWFNLVLEVCIWTSVCILILIRACPVIWIASRDLILYHIWHTNLSSLNHQLKYLCLRFEIFMIPCTENEGGCESHISFKTVANLG